MRVLLVEDQATWAETIMSSFDGGVVFDLATNRDEALGLIADRHYDVAVCDLRIPPMVGSVAEVEHGLAVLTEIRARWPGTPIIGFTAYKSKEVLDILLREQRQEDFLGTLQNRPVLTVMAKDDLPEFLELLADLRVEFDTLDKIQLVVGLGEPPLEPLPSRVLQVYARQRDCVIVRVTPLTGGRSGVPVLRVRMEKADGAAGPSAVARIADITAVEEERRRLQQLVSGTLPLGSYAEIMGDVHAGAGPLGAVFYQVADDFRALYDVLETDDARAAEAVQRIQTIQAPWREGAPAVELPLRDIRRLLIPDGPWQDALTITGLDAEAAEKVEGLVVMIRRGTVHGDLHGGNMLVGESGTVLIDFAAVTNGPTPLDPVSLELSLLFHPDAPHWESDWPRLDQLERWVDFDAYSQDCPFPQFLHSCREWAIAVARGNQDFYACAYAYVASQARFNTSDPARLAALTRGLVPLLT